MSAAARGRSVERARSSTTGSVGEGHRLHRVGWLRAAVLGANDGILSTASLIVGVAAAASSRAGILVAGIAGLVAGAMSMAAGEYVSVSSQADTERADLAREREELRRNPDLEVAELQAIYETRGLSASLAREVSKELMAHDPLGAHARDELGITDIVAARPVQAALTSAASFAVGAALPLATAALVPIGMLVAFVSTVSVVFLAGLGAMAAGAGGASRTRGAARVALWGVLAMALTAAVGRLFGTVL